MYGYRKLQSTLGRLKAACAELLGIPAATYVRYAVITGAVALSLLVAFEWVYSPSITQVRYRAHDDPEFRSVTLPLKMPSPPKSHPLDYEFLATVKFQPHNGTKFRFIPDDCVRNIIINGRILNLSGIEGVCDWRHGFSLDLKDYLVDGENILYVKVADTGAAVYALDITPYMFTPIGSYFKHSALIFLGFAFFWRKIARRLGMDLAEQCITFLALYLYVVQVNVMPYMYYNFDTSGHLFYLSYVFNNLSIPPTHAEWQTYQPPLYYVLANVFHAIVGLPLGWSLIDSGRMVSLMAEMVMLCFVFLSARFQFGPGTVARLTLALVAFWPLAAATAARLTNEVLCYAFWSGALYFLLRWHESRAPKDLFWTALLTIFVYATKMNGIVMMAILGTLLLVHACRDGVKPVWKNCMAARPKLLLFVALLAFASHTGRTIYYNMAVDAKRPLMVGNFHDEGNQNPLDDAENAVWQFLYFDYRAYLESTHFSYYDRNAGTQYFWNTFLKTLVFTDATWNKSGLMMLISFFFLVFLAYLLTGIYRQLMQPSCGWKDLPESSWKILPYTICFVLMLCALAAARIYLPKIGMADGRYVYPIIMLIGLAFGRTIMWHREQGQVRQAQLGIGLYSSFILMNLIFLLGQHW